MLRKDPGSEAEISPNAPNFPGEGPRPVGGGDGAGGRAVKRRGFRSPPPQAAQERLAADGGRHLGARAHGRREVMSAADPR
jgi:hypothetical protein